MTLQDWYYNEQTIFFSGNLIAYNVVVLLLFISHSRAVFSDPGIVPLPAHPIDFSDEHQQGPDSKRGTKSNTESIPCGLLTNQTPPDEGNANVLYKCLIL